MVKDGILYLIDFGLSQIFVDDTTAYRKKAKL
jgi:hypothetical protein